MRAVRAVGMSAVVVMTSGALTAAGGVEVREQSPTDRGRECHPSSVVARGTAHGADPDDLSARQLARADAQLRRAERSLPDSGPDTEATRPIITVDVYAHVVRSKDAAGVARPRIARQLDVLDGAFRGAQSPAAARTPFRFRLAAVDVTVNDRWSRMAEGSDAETQAKRSLHRGGGKALNLYIASLSSGILGWGTQPTRLDVEPTLDGVVIARHTLPGGGAGHYSAGDAAVHEAGHWLGLFHTFAGKCGTKGDFVKDTPAERRPSYTCPTRRDTCAAKGRDPVHNFMDYSYDSCMDRFTPGQTARMVRAWNALRSTHVRGQTP